MTEPDQTTDIQAPEPTPEPAPTIQPPAAAAPVEVKQPEPAASSPDEAAIRARVRAELKAEQERKIEEARKAAADEAVAAVKKELEEEARLAGLDEVSRLREQLVKAEREKQDAAALAEAKAKEAEAVAAAKDREIAIRDALSAANVKLASNATGQVDPAIHDMVTERLTSKLDAGAPDYGTALEELRAESPWMFAAPPVAEAAPTTTGSPGPRGVSVPTRPRVDPTTNALRMSRSEFASHLRQYGGQL